MDASNEVLAMWLWQKSIIVWALHPRHGFVGQDTASRFAQNEATVGIQNRKPK